ncbi:hypothetical protein EV127DRAFT_472747 [Xylaria flabelliformis]|nr:hypothetical protein EV127DRAFT_472747 [Xylaria flabelliformis]
MSFLACSNTNDQSIGPNVLGCRDDFDFTVKFEQLFFSLTPSGIFIVLSIIRIIALTRRPIVVEASHLWLGKLVELLLKYYFGIIVSYATLELALLILVGIGSFSTTGVAISASTLRFVAALCIIPLSLLEHNRSPRPSVLLGAYLFLTLLLDIAQARTFWLASSTRPEIAYSAVFTAAVAVKTAIVLFEAQNKTGWVKWDEKSHSPEETSGIYSLGLYSWLNRLAVSGYRKVLQVPDLYPLDSAMASAELHSHFVERFDSSMFAGHKYRLLLVLSRTLLRRLLLPILPRLVLIGFTLSQPFFIQSLINYLAKPPGSVSANIGYGFIGACILIYSGIALSTALYWYFQYRMLYMVRGTLVAAIYAKTTETNGDDNASLTLMSTDIERIYQGFRTLHEVWANTIQVAISAFLLYRQLGPAFVVPIVIVILCAVAILVPIRYTARGQRRWMDGVQKRVGLTSGVIASMKNLKISGLTIPIGSFVHQLRISELSASTEYRKLVLISATLAYTPLLISPFLTFAIAQRTLDVAGLFASLAYLLLMTQPLTQLFQSFPLIIGGTTCLDRIQSFCSFLFLAPLETKLESKTRQDYRIAASNSQRNTEKSTTASEPGLTTNFTQEPIVTVENGSFGWLPGQMVLNNVDIRIQKASLTIVVGPIASGKSSLCKALLGEMPYSDGKVIIDARSSRVGYCDQVPFLSNGSIRDNIIGFSPFDAGRYEEVIEATLLAEDCETLPQGHDTIIGSNGITLSGGQKQRVSLARTLYLQTDLLILDDIFSGLDSDTEDQVFERVFGKTGLLRNRNVSAVLCTHSVRHLPVANHIIALDLSGRVVEQGNFDDLITNQGYIHNLGIKPSVISDKSSADISLKSETTLPPTKKSATKSTVPEVNDRARQNGDTTVYKIYFKSMGLLCKSSYPSILMFVRASGSELNRCQD